MSDAPEHQPRRERRYRLRALIPNILTIMGLCAGLTAVRFAMDGNFQQSAGLIILAAALDVLDGRSARLLNSQSRLGAELDSFSDSISFGVAPALLVYLWALHAVPAAGWAVVLLFVTCCVLRLARFNAALDDEDPSDGRFFVGIPAPAAAGLAMMPMAAWFSLQWDALQVWWVSAAVLTALAGLMVSRVPTPSFKRLRVSRSSMLLVLIGVAALVACLVADAWLTLALIGVIYLALIPITARYAARLRGAAASGGDEA